MATLTNAATLEALYNSQEVVAESSVSVEVVNATFEKTADREVWINGDLTYTVQISNDDDSTEPKPLTDVVFEDTINTAIAQLVEGSIEINGSPVAAANFDYNDTTGALVVRVSDALGHDIEPDTSVTITFRVEKA